MTLEHIHGGDVTGAAESLGLDRSRLLDFSANINPLGPPPGVLEAISAHMDEIVDYPDPRCRELKKALAEHLGVREKYIIMGNGVSELIYLLARVLKCRRALIPVPTFTEYALAVKVGGGEVREIPLSAASGYSLDVGEIEKLIAPGDLIFLCNPNNPTGNLYSRPILRRLLETAAFVGAYLVVDEAFIDFVPRPEENTLIPMSGNSPALLVFYSLTKFFGIPGLRLGAMLGPAPLVEKMNGARDPWNVNLFAQVAGVAALKDREHMQKTRELVTAEREYLYRGLESLPGVQPYPGTANFLFAGIKDTGLSVGKLTAQMRRKGVLVRDCSSFTGLGEDYIRVAVKTREKNTVLLNEMARVLEGARE